jgi:hypothetical protein
LTSRTDTVMHPTPFQMNQMLFVAQISLRGRPSVASHPHATDWNSHSQAVLENYLASGLSRSMVFASGDGAMDRTHV